MIRSFVAIDLSTVARTALTTLQNRLKFGVPPHTVTWTAPQNIHLTLHFLGDVTAEAIDKIAETFEAGIFGHTAFTLDLVGLGCFPNMRRPRIIWVGIGGNTESLVELHGHLGRLLNEATGFVSETRPYAPHLTIGRVKKGIPQRRLTQAGQILATEQAGVGQLTRFIITEVVLMRSELKPGGPVYTPLARGVLKGN